MLASVTIQRWEDHGLMGIVACRENCCDYAARRGAIRRAVFVAEGFKKIAAADLFAADFVGMANEWLDRTPNKSSMRLVFFRMEEKARCRNANIKSDRVW